MRQLLIDKNQQARLYRPDYLLCVAGIPLIVVEAKSPAEKCEDGYREARLYADELNTYWKHSVNPVQLIVSCNGRRLLAGYSDAQPLIDVAFDEINPQSPEFAEFLTMFSYKAVKPRADDIRRSTVVAEHFRALNLLGGHSVRDEDVGYNTFGSKLAIDYRAFFNPQSTDERRFIVEHAYVTSPRRQHYVDEIDRIIQSAVPVILGRTENRRSSAKAAFVRHRTRFSNQPTCRTFCSLQ